MKLTVIITHYNEPSSVYTKLLESIRAQRPMHNAEVNVLIVHDGEQDIDELREIEERFKDIPHDQAVKEHAGVANARNFGISLADGDYVMFCDCDDVFSSIYGFHALEKAMEKHPDVIVSAFYEESITHDRDGEKFDLLTHEKDMAFIHGKAFRREYLIENDIAFPYLEHHEDGPMVRLACMLTGTIQYIPTPFYTWVCNPASTMRRLPRPLLDTYEDLMAARSCYIEELIERGKNPYEFVVKTIFDCYYDFQKDEFARAEDIESVEKAANAFCNLYKKYREIFSQADPYDCARLANQARQEAYAGGLIMETQTFGQFLNRVENRIR